MSSVDEDTNVLDDEKEVVVTTHVDKGTEKLEDTKKAVVKILRKDSDNFDGQSKGYKG